MDKDIDYGLDALDGFFTEPPQKRRWYDFNATLAPAVEEFRRLRAEHQMMIAEAIVEFTNFSNMIYSDVKLKNLGSDKVLGLMKSKCKRRWYDQDPLLHRAFSYLYLMGEAQRTDFGTRIGLAIQTIDNHLNGQGGKPDPRVLRRQVFLIFERSVEETARILEPDAEPAKSAAEPKVEKEEKKISKVLETDSGMRVSDKMKGPAPSPSPPAPPKSVE